MKSTQSGGTRMVISPAVQRMPPAGWEEHSARRVKWKRNLGGQRDNGVTRLYPESGMWTRGVRGTGDRAWKARKACLWSPFKGPPKELLKEEWRPESRVWGHLLLWSGSPMNPGNNTRGRLNQVTNKLHLLSETLSLGDNNSSYPTEFLGGLKEIIILFLGVLWTTPSSTLALGIQHSS